MKNYYQEIEDEAIDFINNYEEEINETIKENKDEEPEDIFWKLDDSPFYLNDKVHEWLDNAWYGFLRSDFCENEKTELASCVKILDESENRETDSGLWEGQEPEKAIQTQAFFTARTDLYEEIRKQVINLIEEKQDK